MSRFGQHVTYGCHCSASRIIHYQNTAHVGSSATKPGVPSLTSDNQRWETHFICQLLNFGTGFLPHIHVMPSLQKPRKIGMEASNGEQYFFLCKPKDDLRKDARLMDFNSVVNKLLRANSDSRRRQLRMCNVVRVYTVYSSNMSDIRTYSVVPLNEECGLIEWVRNTVPFRSLLKPRYEARGISLTVRLSI